jgi:hypothetical protein
VSVVGSTVSSNRAAHCAGMLLDTPTHDSLVRSSRFEGNVAGQQTEDDISFGQLPQWNSTGSGGGMCIVPGGAVSITASTITQNTALHGGESTSGCRLGSLLSSDGLWAHDLCVWVTGRLAHAHGEACLTLDQSSSRPVSWLSGCCCCCCSWHVCAGLRLPQRQAFNP